MAEQRVQRRIAAILAADVVGYSRLMEADEAGTLDRLKALRRVDTHSCQARKLESEPMARRHLRLLFALWRSSRLASRSLKAV